LTAPGHDADERRLVEAAQRDLRRFADLYEAHFDRVYAYVMSRVRNRAAAEDVTSHVFHQALAALPRYEWRGVPFAAWLLRIASNAVNDHWQRSARERGNPAPEPVANPDTETIEHHAQLARMVRTLPADQRRVVEARFLEQKSIREIAQEMRRTEGAIKQLQFRALEALRAQMSGTHG